MIDISKTLRDFDKRLKALGFTPQEFCPRVPMHFTAYYRWKKRERVPTIEKLSRFESALRRAEGQRK